MGTGDSTAPCAPCSDEDGGGGHHREGYAEVPENHVRALVDMAIRALLTPPPTRAPSGKPPQ
jgi:hypothetical protein